MNKKLLVIPALLVAIGGGAALAQTDLLAKADVHPSISAAQAKEIALKQVQGKIVDFDYEGDDYTPHYEIDVVKGNEKIEITVDALTGKSKITERETIQNKVATQNSTKPTPQALISEQQAIQIALAKAPGKVVKVELDEDDNQWHYDIEIRNGNTEYDFEIDAKTGAIIDFEKDLDDDRDDDDHDDNDRDDDDDDLDD
ncbi:MAG: PepSY domain-containing protein [Solibacillus sp.]